MTRATHTPGPWSIQGESDYIDVGYSSGRICMIECEDDQQTPEESYANARLIAAAPELLAALEALRGEAEMLRRQYGREGNTEWADRQAWLVEKADAAIAKAKGE